MAVLTEPTGIEKLARWCLRTEHDTKGGTEFVERELEQLPPVMRYVLVLRFGLFGEPVRPRDEVAVFANVNKYRVQDLEEAGIRRIRKAARL